jgi:hypothetical protein
MLANGLITLWDGNRDTPLMPDTAAANVDIMDRCSGRAAILSKKVA